MEGDKKMKVYNIIEALNAEPGTKFNCIKSTSRDSIYSPIKVVCDEDGVKWLVDGIEETINALNSISINLEFVLYEGGEE